MNEIDQFKKYKNMMYGLLEKYNIIQKKDNYLDLCYIGYTKALNNFDGEKSSFGTFAYKCMENELLAEFRKEKYIKNKVNNKVLSLNYEYESSTLGDMILDKTDIQRDLIYDETIRELYQAIFKLNIREQYIILNSFKLVNINNSMNEVYKKLEISRSTGCIIKNKALVKLKRLLKEKQV